MPPFNHGGCSGQGTGATCPAPPSIPARRALGLAGPGDVSVPVLCWDQQSQESQRVSSCWVWLLLYTTSNKFCLSTRPGAQIIIKAEKSPKRQQSEAEGVPNTAFPPALGAAHYRWPFTVPPHQLPGEPHRVPVPAQAPSTPLRLLIPKPLTLRYFNRHLMMEFQYV